MTTAMAIRTSKMYQVQIAKQPVNRLSVWEKGERVQQLPTIFGVRFPYNPIYLLCIHVRVCSYKTICEKKYEITACMINVWGYTKSYLRRIQPAIRLWRLCVMCVRAGPPKCRKSCANGSNIVTFRFGYHGTKYILGVVGLKVLPVSNFALQLLTTTQQRKTCNRMCKRTQHVTCNNVASVCTRLNWK